DYTPDDQQYYFSLVTAAPLIVGLGGEHVLETTITLDRNTGAPFIPGSALKGLTRTVALIELAQALPFEEGVDRLAKLQALDDLLAKPIPAEAKEKERETYFNEWKKLNVELDATTSELHSDYIGRVQKFQSTFGYMGQAGEAIFFDA